MPSRKLLIIGCAAIAVALMSFAAPMAANAAILQEDLFTESDITGTSFSNGTAPYAEVNTGTQQLDFDPDGDDKDSIEYAATGTTTTGTDTALWTLSLDMKVDLGTGGLIKIPLWAGANMLEIYYEEVSGSSEFSMVQASTGSDTDVVEGLPDDTWYHLDLVVNSSGSYVDYTIMDVLAGKADLWIDGELGIWNITVEDTDGLAGGEFESRYGWEKGSIDNWVISSGANVVPEPATMSMLLMALGGLALMFRRRR